MMLVNRILLIMVTNANPHQHLSIIFTTMLHVSPTRSDNLTQNVKRNEEKKP